METYFDNNKKTECNGCGTCALRCPVHAISMQEDTEGFLYPNIDKNKCIECGLCKKTCSNIVNNKIEISKTYISYLLDEKAKSKSSSGGVFYAIAKYVIENNGVVFGVCIETDLSVKHSFAEKIEELSKFQGSKYVRSDLNKSYENVERFLKNNRLVLFTGTPCQCQGLRNYLNINYDNLLTCEIICHANPSPRVYKYYIKNLENDYNKKVKGIYFRTKENGWKNQTPIIEFKDGHKIEELSYRKAFISELINRPSCSNCKFCTTNRYSDFTIGDLWGYNKIDDTLTDNGTGISLFNVNTIKGNRVLELIKNEMFIKEVDTKLAFSYNHHKNIPMHKKREEFFYKLSNETINEYNIINYMNKYTKEKLLDKIVIKLKSIFNNLVKKRKE